MRIWSIHPKYLDTKGLVALWRETLLAKHVLEGKTKGYKNHPQLNRFKAAENPVDCINQYLTVVYEEALNREYKFDKSKINWNYKPSKLTVTSGQLQYETTHLLNNLKTRDVSMYNEVVKNKALYTHPLFEVIQGDIEDWEILNK